MKGLIEDGFNGNLTKKYWLDDDIINSYTDKYDAIIPKHWHINKEEISVETQYQSNHNIDDLHITRKILQELSPDYIETFDKVMKSNSVHLNNMFILRRDIFEKLCEWLFPILNEIDKRVDYTNYNANQSRAVGYISERLVSVFIEKEILNNVNNLRVCELNRVLLRKMRGFKGLIKKLLRKK